MEIIHSMHRESGKVAIDGMTCTNCGSCARVCPADVMRMDNDKLHDSDESLFGCNACGHYVMVCPVKTIAVTPWIESCG